MFPGTIFSEDRKHRYSLYREWDKSKPRIAFIGLNPSTADELVDDATIRRCIQFAKTWGFGSMLVGNVFSFRSTDPKELYKIQDPVGKENDYWLEKIQMACDKTVACWGNHGDFKNRGQRVRLMLSSSSTKPYNERNTLHVFGITKKGYPKHPLYLRKNSKIIRWEMIEL